MSTAKFLLPSLADLSPSLGLDLDEKCAIDHFLGKDKADSDALFCDNPLFYSDDLRWMGAVGFRFYFPSFARYLSSPQSEHDSDSVNAVVSLLQTRLETNSLGISGAANDVLDCLRFCLSHYDRFGINKTIYGDLDRELQHLIERVAALKDATSTE